MAHYSGIKRDLCSYIREYQSWRENGTLESHPIYPMWFTAWGSLKDDRSFGWSWDTQVGERDRDGFHEEIHLHIMLAYAVAERSNKKYFLPFAGKKKRLAVCLSAAHRMIERGDVNIAYSSSPGVRMQVTTAVIDWNIVGMYAVMWYERK